MKSKLTKTESDLVLGLGVRLTFTGSICWEDVGVNEMPGSESASEISPLSSPDQSGAGVESTGKPGNQFTSLICQPALTL